MTITDVVDTQQLEPWAEGAVLDDERLGEDVLRNWTRVARLVGADEAEADVPLDVQSAAGMIREATDWTIGELQRPAAEADHAASAKLLVELNRLGDEVREVAVRWRVRGFAAVHAALGRLRGATSVGQLVSLGPGELCRCGFDRAMLSRVNNSIAIPEAMHWEGRPDLADTVVAAGNANPLELDHTTIETEMIRRRGPILVTDPQHDPRTHRPLIEATGTRRYVAAPIMPQGQVIGFLHADCHVRERLVDEFDRDLLWMFAEGFAHAYERAVLLDRMRALRQEVRRGNQSIIAVMDEFCEADVEVAGVDRDGAGVARSAASVYISSDSRLESLLTKRELDVIRLMAAGETNAGIATKLVVSEGTVKSHVKHILRKLRASNRAEAVSRFIRLSERGSAPGLDADED